MKKSKSDDDRQLIHKCLAVSWSSGPPFPRFVIDSPPAPREDLILTPREVKRLAALIEHPDLIRWLSGYGCSHTKIVCIDPHVGRDRLDRLKLILAFELSKKRAGGKRPQRREYARQGVDSLTKIQQRVLELFAKHEGNISAAAREMKRERKDFRDALNAAFHKLDTTRERYLAALGITPQSIPEDDRGQADVYDTGGAAMREGRTFERRTNRKSKGWG